MNLIKIIKFVLMCFVAIYFFPNYNGLITFVLKLIFYLLLLFLANSLIDESIKFFVKNSHKIYLRYIDEREHIRGNTLGNLKRLDSLGATFRLWHYLGFNKKRIIHGLWHDCLENLPVVIATGLIFITILGFFLNIALR